MSQVFKYSHVVNHMLRDDGKPYMTIGALKSALKTGRNYLKDGEIITITTYDLVPVKEESFQIGENNQLIPL
jgi:hypothetical protein